MRRQLKQIFFFFQKAISTILYPFYIVFNYFSPKLAVPVIMYHKVSNVSPESTDIGYDNVFLAQFQEQMQYLKNKGYNIIDLADYLKWHKGEKKLTAKSVVITFDDGYKSIFANAFPILLKHNFSAAVFLTTDYIGGNMPFDWLKWDENALADKENNIDNWLPLSWDEVKKMNHGNIIIGSHTLSHPHLAKLDQEQIKRELYQSKQKIEKEIKKEVRFFSYPVGIRQYGAFNENTKRELISTGYDMAFVSEIGRNKKGSDLYVQKRIAVAECDSLFDFKCKLAGAYDWVGIAQKAFQNLFSEVD